MEAAMYVTAKTLATTAVQKPSDDERLTTLHQLEH
jgi:hypothetical protein